MLVVFLKRPAGQSQFSVALAAQAPKTRSFSDLKAWIVANLSKPLPAEELAERVAISPGNFASVFVAEFGMTPARFVRQARVEAARILLEQTERSLGEVAARCGFGGDDVMRRTFLEDMNVAPGEYRARFETGPVRSG